MSPRSGLTLGLGMLASCAAPDNRGSPTIEVAVDFHAAHCGMTMAGDGFADAAALLPAIRESGARRVLLVVSPDVPYRCLGPLTVELQHQGYAVTFVAEPPPS